MGFKIRTLGELGRSTPGKAWPPPITIIIVLTIYRSHGTYAFVIERVRESEMKLDFYVKIESIINGRLVRRGKKQRSATVDRLWALGLAN